MHMRNLLSTIVKTASVITTVKVTAMGAERLVQVSTEPIPSLCHAAPTRAPT